MILQSLLIQLGVKEVILPADEKSTDYDLNKIRTVIERCAIVVSDRKRCTCLPTATHDAHIALQPPSTPRMSSKTSTDSSRPSSWSPPSVRFHLISVLRQASSLTIFPAEFDLKIAMASTAALVSYLSLMNDTSNHNSYTLETHDLSQYMKLDASALRALNRPSLPLLLLRC